MAPWHFLGTNRAKQKESHHHVIVSSGWRSYQAGTVEEGGGQWHVETQRIALSAPSVELSAIVIDQTTALHTLTENRKASTYLQPPVKLPRRKCTQAPRVELVECGP